MSGVQQGGDYVRRKFQPPSEDKHHICYTRKKWKVGKLRCVRIHQYCVIRLPRELHENVHAVVPEVPTPRGDTAGYVKEQLDYLLDFGAISINDSFEKRLSVLIALFECIEQPTADALKKQLQLAHEFYKTPR